MMNVNPFFLFYIVSMIAVITYGVILFVEIEYYNYKRWHYGYRNRSRVKTKPIPFSSSPYR